MLPVTVTDNGTRLQFDGTLTGTHVRVDAVAPTTQTVHIDLRKVNLGPP